MISVNNVSVVFGGFCLLDSVSFMIDKRDKIGLAGKNGAGKSTLLKMLAGLQQPSSGSISRSGSVRIGYLPQTMIYADGKTVRKEAEKAFASIAMMRSELKELNIRLAERDDYESDTYVRMLERISELTEQLAIHGEGSIDAEVEVVLKGLGFSQSDMERRCEEFSGGWRMRIELAKILLERPDIFLLDEPTNHLDIESISWLESFLQSYSGALVLVSHDRAFLDNVTKRTIEIFSSKVHDYKVPYTKYIELRRERIDQQMRAYLNQQKQIKDTEDFIERFRYKATKSVQVQSRIKQLEKLDRIEIEKEDASSINIRFQPAVRSGETVLTGRNLSKSYGDKEVLRDVNLDVKRGEKIAFVGKNGEGKTTMVRMIMNELPFEGELKKGHNVNIGYFAQNQADLMDTKLTVLDTVDQVAVGEIRKKMRDILGAFLFSGDDVDKKVEVLSGGERTRLSMVKLLLEPYNLLILDEPTNHLDIRTKDILKQALRDFEGTVIVVSHDRDFLNGLVDRVLEFADKNVKEYLGGVSDFLEAKKVQCFKEYESWQGNIKKSSQATEAAPIVNKEATGKKSFEEFKRASKELRKAEQAVNRIENEITESETLKASLSDKMTDEDFSVEVYREYEEVNNKIKELMEEWEAATELVEKLKNI
ncbi:MAG: ABC-F family ATP-binding cassette domain-containing protein [Culturomica sp.]|nr:ABC-F family ATP-binding cassette domain-containing protein [Culturomica sp.]